MSGARCRKSCSRRADVIRVTHPNPEGSAPGIPGKVRAREAQGHDVCNEEIGLEQLEISVTEVNNKFVLGKT